MEALADPDCGWFYRRNANEFIAIPGSPIAYWASDAMLRIFQIGISLGSLCDVRKGVTTSDNERFLRLWWEVSHNRERFDCRSTDDSVESRAKWFPCNKGGEFRKWYGNNDYVINWENDGEEVRSFERAVVRNASLNFKPSVTWSDISSGQISFRYKPVGHVFNASGPSFFGKNNTLLYLQGAMNCSVIQRVSHTLSPTLHFEVGQVALYPVVLDNRELEKVSSIVVEQRILSEIDWNSFEETWDFKSHPLI